MWSKLFAAENLLQRGMEASWLRNAVIRNNIANSETPDFKASDVEFESYFRDALYADTGIEEKKTRAKHRDFGKIDLDAIVPVVRKNDDISMLMNGNNVDIENENVKLAQNSIQYNTLVYKLNSELTRLRLAISEGK